METVSDIIKIIFDPHNTDSRIPKSLKLSYLEHYLRKHWEEICGANLAKNCALDKLREREMQVRCANSLMANELYMMQDIFLAKVNKLLGGALCIKKVYFRTGSVPERKKLEKVETAEAFHGESRCPACGARKLAEDALCSVCAREKREGERKTLRELLRIQPWLSYEQCCLYFKCDKILFNSVKDNLKNYYFERVRLGYATKEDELFAVLFLLGKEPEKINSYEHENALAYLRRDQSVSAFGSRLYGGKQ